MNLRFGDKAHWLQPPHTNGAENKCKNKMYTTHSAHEVTQAAHTLTIKCFILCRVHLLFFLSLAILDSRK